MVTTPEGNDVISSNLVGSYEHVRTIVRHSCRNVSSFLLILLLILQIL